MGFALKSEGYIAWNTPIDAGVRAALVDFFSALTDQYTLGGRNYSLRSLLRKHLDAPLAAFLRSAGVDADPISRWGTPNDLGVDRTAAALAPLMANDERMRATTEALVGLGHKLNGCRTYEASKKPLQSFEYCECCDRYTERYQNALEDRTYLGRKALVHPLITGDPLPLRDHRFCDSCSSQKGFEAKSDKSRRYGPERGAIRFSRLMMEDRLGPHNNAEDFLDIPRFPAGVGTAFHGAWPWTKRTMARLISSGLCSGVSSTQARMRHLGKRELHQNELIIEVIRSLLPAHVTLPSWLLQRTGDFAQVELATILHASKQRLVLSGYGRRGIRRTCIRDITSADAMPLAKQAFSEVIAKLAITPRNWIELEFPNLSAQFRADLEEHRIDESRNAQDLKGVPPKFQAFVRKMMIADESARGHVRFVCQVERSHQYQWLVDHLRTESTNSGEENTFG